MKLIYFFFAMHAVTMLCSNSVYAVDNVHFSGALVAEPCSLPDSETDIKLDFGSVIEKSLYQSQRTQSLPFTIHLEDCDTSMIKTVSVTFGGTADGELTTMLALEPSSSAKGIAIGLELEDGTALEINKLSPYMALNDGSNTLTFNAFVQAQPSKLLDKSLIAGDFTAISTFVLGYQ